MLYRGPFSTRFYRRLHGAVHKEFRLRRAAGTVSLLTHVARAARRVTARDRLGRLKDAANPAARQPRAGWHAAAGTPMTQVDLSRAESLATIAEAFSRTAQRYDQFADDHPHLTRMRGKVYDHLERVVPHGARILELNAGTGTDAVELARRGYRVHATDIAPGMLARIEDKIARFGLGDTVTAQACSFLDLAQVTGAPYDAVFSNLGGLNCTRDLRPVAAGLRTVLRPGGTAVLVLMPPICLWELATAASGRFSLAFRRLARGGTRAHLEGRHFQVHYFTPGRAIRALGERLEGPAGRGALRRDPDRREQEPRETPSAAVRRARVAGRSRRAALAGPRVGRLLHPVGPAAAVSYPIVPGKHDRPSVLEPRDMLALRRRQGRHPDAPALEAAILCLRPGLPERRRLRWQVRLRRAGRLLGPLYVVRATGERVGVLTGFGMGAPVMAAEAEELIALGARRLIAFGPAGGLRPELAAGTVVVATGAIRDEGTSYHYLPAGEEVCADEPLSETLASAIRARGATVRRGMTWSTDAPFRETREEVAHHRARGVLTVDMEAAALFAVASVRGVPAAVALVVGDSLAGERWQPPDSPVALDAALVHVYRAAIEVLGAR